MYKYIKMPREWTAEQAWAVVEFIHHIEELIWDTYEDELLKLAMPQSNEPPDLDFCSNQDPDDDIPF